MITIKLLSNKESSISVSEETRATRSEALVVSGEADVTEIKVIYPDSFKDWRKRVDITNARKESTLMELEGFEKPLEGKTEHGFALPSSAVKYKGYATIVFKAFSGDKAFVWEPIQLPVIDGGGLGSVATNAPDLVAQAYEKSGQALQKAAAAELNSAEAKQDAENAINTVTALVQPPDISEANKEGTVIVAITQDGRLKFSNLKGGTPVLRLGDVETLPPGSESSVTLDNTNPLAPTFNFALASGPQGPPGSGVAAGLSTVQVVKSDWISDNKHGYRLEIGPEKHCLGDTNQIMVEANPRLGSGTSTSTRVRTSFDSAVKETNGIVTLYSRVPWEGYVFCAGGAATATDAQARQNIEGHKANTVAHITAEERSAWNAKETPTAAQGKADGALQAAKSYADSKVAEVIGAAPEMLDTLKELASAVGDNPNHAAEMMEMVGKKADKAAFEAHSGNGDIHITAAERGAWGAKETPAGAQAKADAALAAANVVAAGKADKAAFDTHAANSGIHITAVERQVWNSKETPAGAQAKADAALSSANTHADTHAASRANPHGVTAAQVGLGNVDNTRDADKSVAAADALKAIYSNEVVIGQGFAGGELYMGYRGTNAAISAYRFCDGQANGALAQIKAAALFEGETRVYSPNNKPAAEDITSGTLNALRIPADYLKAGNNVTLSRDAAGKVTITAAFGTTAPFKKTITAADWVEGSNGYGIAIEAAEHGKGTDPIIEIYNSRRRQVYDSPEVDEAGNIRLYSQSAVTLYVKIR